MNPFDLTGRTALVTGSSRGLGRAMAEGLAAAGAAIVLNGSDAGRLSAAASDLRTTGPQVHEARFDVTDEAGIVFIGATSTSPFCSATTRPLSSGTTFMTI